MKYENRGDWSLAYRAVYPAGWLIAGLALKVLSPRFHVMGRGNVPRRGAVIFAPNHLSNVDPVLVGYAALRPVAFMAKRSLFDIPVLGSMMRFANAFPVEQNSPDRAALRQAEAQLQRGNDLVIFPEGQCSPDGKLQPLLPGVALLALKCDVPVIPVGIVGSDKLMPYAKVLPRFTLSKVKINFAPPLEMDDLKRLSSREARARFNERLEAALRGATGQ